MLIKYKANGMERDVRDAVAKALIRRNLARAVEPAQSIPRAQAAPPPTGGSDLAPYGLKADGTPRARPGRKASATDANPPDGTYNRRDMQAKD